VKVKVKNTPNLFQSTRQLTN